jgi:hypothetical protein
MKKYKVKAKSFHLKNYKHQKTKSSYRNFQIYLKSKSKCNNKIINRKIKKDKI